MHFQKMLYVTLTYEPSILKMSMPPKVLITGKNTCTAVIEGVILRFIALHGRHDAQIIVKFGIAKGTKGPLCMSNFNLIGLYLGISDHKYTKKIWNFANLFAK